MTPEQLLREIQKTEQNTQLKNAYDQIQEANKEIEVQSEIARFISTTFDIGKVVSLITTSIVETKKVAFAAIYIDKNVYMNPQSNCVVKAVDDGIKRKLTRDLPEFYLNYKQKYSIFEYPNTDKYRQVLEKFGYDLTQDMWLGTKSFKKYGNDTKSIIQGILDEIGKLQKCFS